VLNHLRCKKIGVDNLELYWLAGILEGEGCFSFGTKKTPNRVAITVCMTDRDVVERVAKLFGVNWILEIKRGKHKTQWRTQLRGAKAIELMKKIQSIMGERRRLKIQEVINSYDPELFKKKHTKIEDDVVARIYLESQIPGKTLTEIANKYRVSAVTVSHIKRNMARTEITSNQEFLNHILKEN